LQGFTTAVACIGSDLLQVKVLLAKVLNRLLYDLVQILAVSMARTGGPL
jgi:hypothetical protein